MSIDLNNLPNLPPSPQLQDQLNDALQRIAAQAHELQSLRQQHGCLLDPNAGSANASGNDSANASANGNNSASATLYHVNMVDECMKGKVPDLIKGIPTFSGRNPKQVGEWIQCVDRILKQYKHLEGSELYELWLQEVRNKITESASDKLASQGTPLDWNEIKNQLKFFYGDKREMSTLLQKLFVLHQGGRAVDDFMAEIQDVFTGISTLIQVDPEWINKQELIRFIDKMCLEKFIDGLQEPFSSHVGILQPKTLNQAYQFAVEKANKIARRSGRYDLRKPVQQPMNKPSVQYNPPNYRPRYNLPTNFNPGYNQYPNQNRPPQSMPLNTQQRPQQFPQQIHQQFSNQRPQQNLPQNNSTRQSFRNSFQNRTGFQRSEPMDIDPSTQSRLVNYMNRPQYQIEETEQDYFAHPENYLHYNTEEPETPQPEESVNDDKEEDDLNFQMAVGQTPAT